MKIILPFVFLASAILPAFSLAGGAAVYRPGLTQARIPLGSEFGYKAAYTGVPVLASNLLENAQAEWLDRTLDVFKDGEHANDAVNPVSGKSWPWLIESRHGVFAWEGEIFVEEGVEYYFYGRFWTGEALTIDGETVVWQGSHNGYNYPPDVKKLWTAPKTGWVPFNAWEWTCEESFGPQWTTWGLQYNLDGVVVEGDDISFCRKIALNSNTNVWKRFEDTGNGTFLRTKTTERFTSVISSEETLEGISFSLDFKGVPAEASLVAFTGETDGLHDSSSWGGASDTLAEVPAGDSQVVVTVPVDDSAKVLRFRLAHFDPDSTTGNDNFEEWTDVYPVTAAPVVNLSSVKGGYTDAVLSGSIVSFGIGGESGAVTLEIFPESGDGSAPSAVASLTLPETSDTGDFSATLSGLTTNAAYVAIARIANDNSETGVSSAISFRTLQPSPPSASLATSLCYFNGAKFNATISDFGGGSTDAEIWIDVSSEPFFLPYSTKTVTLGRIDGTLPQTIPADVSTLDFATDYFARIRAVNTWGIGTVSEPIAFTTASIPIAFPQPTAEAAKGYVSVSVAPLSVADGTIYDVQLWADGPGFSGIWRTWSNVSDVETFAWGREIEPGQVVTFRYTINWKYEAEGLSGTIELEASSEAKIADVILENLPELSTHYLRVGEEIGIQPSAGARIDWHTNAVLSVSEKLGQYLVTALEPGATLLYETDASGVTNNITAQAIIFPAEAPSGGIYIHRALKDWSWTDPTEWEVVEPGSGAYPNGPGAMVYIVSDAIGSNDTEKQIEITEPVTIGFLAVGQLGWIHHGEKINGTSNNPKSHWPWIFSDKFDEGGSIRFDTGDGSASWLRLLGHSYTTSRVLFQVPVSMANDLEIDELNRIQDTIGWQNTRFRGLWFMKPFDIGTNELRTVRAHPYHYWFNAPTSRPAGGVESAGWISFRNDIIGSGSIKLQAATHVGLVGADGAHIASFSGSWDVANGDLDPKLNSAYGGAGLNTWGLSLGASKEMTIRGSWHRADKTWPRGALVRTGFNNIRTSETTGNGCTGHAWTNDWQDALPSKIVLDGGVLQFHPQGPMNNVAKAAYTTTGIRQNIHKIETLSVPAGAMGRLESKNKNNNANYPNVRVQIANIVLEEGAVLSFDLDGDLTQVRNELFISNDPADAWTPNDDATKQFLPFLFANNQTEATGGNTALDMSAAALDNTRLAFRDRNTGKVSLESPATTGNEYRRWTQDSTLADGESFYSMQLAKDIVVSFSGAPAIVKNLSGYVDMRGGSVLGQIDTDKNATLDFGTQPARIFVGNWSETGTIGCKLSCAHGLVKGGNGILALAGQNEIDGDIRIAGGTLSLATKYALQRGREHCISVEAGSVLSFDAPRATRGTTRVFLNDRDWIPSLGHIQINAPATVTSLAIGGVHVSPGTYGSSESTAENIDDDHFIGTETLTVLTGGGLEPTLLILR